MDIKQTSVKAIYKLASEHDYTNLYNALKQKVPAEDFIFAEPKIGAGYYLWGVDDKDWTPFVNADEFERGEVIAERDRRFKAVRAALGADYAAIAEKVLTTPGDDFLYFCHDGGKIRIILTGWGYKKPVTPPVGPGPEWYNVNISLIRDGEKLTNYPFFIRMEKGEARKQTDANGVFSFQTQALGSAFTIIDDESGKELSRVIAKGDDGEKRIFFDIDVTEHVSVTVRMTKDGAPMANESVSVSYRGRTQDFVTDASGIVRLSLPYHKGEMCVVMAKGETKTQELIKPSIDFTFSYQTPPPEKSQVRIKVTDRGVGKAGAACVVRYAGKDYNLVTDASGCCSVEVENVRDEDCVVTMNGQNLSKKLLPGMNEFSFVDDTPLPPPVLRDFAPRIFIEGINGYIGVDYPITVTYNGVSTKYTGDSEGKVYLPVMKEGESMVVADDFNKNNVQTFVLDADVEEYVFHIPYEPVTSQWDITVSAIDVKGKPIANKKVLFRQDGSPDLLTTLDENGRTGFGKDAFRYDKPMIALIKTDDNRYAPIEFTLDEKETEYVLQEYEKCPWYVRIGEILAILAFWAVVLFGGYVLIKYLSM